MLPWTKLMFSDDKMQTVVRSSAVASRKTCSINDSSISSSSEHDDYDSNYGSGSGSYNDNGSISLLVTRIQEWMAFQPRRKNGNHKRKAFCDRWCWCTVPSMIKATRTGSGRQNLAVGTVLVFLLSNFRIFFPSTSKFTKQGQK